MGLSSEIGDVSTVATRDSTLTCHDGNAHLVCVFTPSDDEDHREVMSELSSRLGSSVTWITTDGDNSGIASAAGADAEPFIALVSWREHGLFSRYEYDVSDMTYCCDDTDGTMHVAADLWQKVDDMSNRKGRDDGWSL